MTTRRSPGFLFPAVCAMLAAVGGCGEGSVPRAAIHGTVTLDDQPVDGAHINFVPIKGTAGPTAGGPIVKGAYDLSTGEGPMVGWNRVEIRGLARKTGRQFRAMPPAPSGAMIDETVEGIPARYNKASTLEVELKPGRNTQDFELKSE